MEGPTHGLTFLCALIFSLSLNNIFQVEFYVCRESNFSPAINDTFLSSRTSGASAVSKANIRSLSRRGHVSRASSLGMNWRDQAVPIYINTALPSATRQLFFVCVDLYPRRRNLVLQVSEAIEDLRTRFTHK